MRIALTGGSGIIGGFLQRGLLAAKHDLTILNRRNGYQLGDDPDLSDHDALIHCAFAHAPGRYRGGEGDDPETFRRLNLDGSLHLFDAAAKAGVSRILFLSSRAVHDGQPKGVALTDDLPARPANLYGEVKVLAEDYLQRLDLSSTSIRATGIYGPGSAHKWRGLFADYLAGKPIAPRIATEIHGEDLAAAVLILLKQDNPPPVVNASDLILDRHDLLAEVQHLTGSQSPLPARGDIKTVRALHCDALTAMGWRPGGMEQLRASLPSMLDGSPHL